MPDQRIAIDSGGLRLEGVLHAPDGDGPFPAVVICHPHPQYGGSMHNNVVAALVAGALQHGIAALRFNFRGVEGSEGNHDGGAGEQDDVRAALACARGLEVVDSARVGLAGYSFGAGMAARVVDPSIPALALVALPLSMAEPAVPALAAYAAPLLFLSGDRDRGSSENGLRDLVTSIGRDAEVEIVPGADHFWGGYEHEIAARAGAFFARALGGEGAAS
jgi:alpha/beta superfamily hydrolase